MVTSAIAKGKVLYQENNCKLDLSFVICLPAVCTGERASIVSFQHSRREIYPVWPGVLAAGLFHFWFGYDHLPGIHHPVYLCFRQAILWLGLSPDDIYGNGVQEN